MDPAFSCRGLSGKQDEPKQGNEQVAEWHIEEVSYFPDQKVRRWLKLHPRFHRHFTPTNASWMNMVERFFHEKRNRQKSAGIPHLPTLSAYFRHCSFYDRYEDKCVLN